MVRIILFFTTPPIRWWTSACSRTSSRARFFHAHPPPRPQSPYPTPPLTVEPNVLHIYTPRRLLRRHSALPDGFSLHLSAFYWVYLRRKRLLAGFPNPFSGGLPFLLLLPEPLLGVPTFCFFLLHSALALLCNRFFCHDWMQMITPWGRELYMASLSLVCHALWWSQCQVVIAFSQTLNFQGLIRNYTTHGKQSMLFVNRIFSPWHSQVSTKIFQNGWECRKSNNF